MEQLTLLAEAISLNDDERKFPGLFLQLQDVLIPHPLLLGEALSLGLPHLLVDCLELNAHPHDQHALACAAPLLVAVARFCKDTSTSCEDLQVTFPKCLTPKMANGLVWLAVHLRQALSALPEADFFLADLRSVSSCLSTVVDLLPEQADGIVSASCVRGFPCLSE